VVLEIRKEKNGMNKLSTGGKEPEKRRADKPKEGKNVVRLSTKRRRNFRKRRAKYSSQVDWAGEGKKK